MNPGTNNFISALTSGKLAGQMTTPQATAAPAPAKQPTAAPTNGGASPTGVYWVGTDGNAWVKDANGVRNAGKVINARPNGFDSSLMSLLGYKQIDDPNPQYPTTTAPANSNGGTRYQDKSNDLAIQNAGLNAVGATRDAGINNVEKSLATIMGEYDTDAANANKSYTDESNANQQDLQTNKQTALETAMRGRQGLFGTLASLGALSGTGIDLANDAVRKGANEDLTNAGDTFATNQNALDSGYNAFKRQDEQRRTQAKTNAANDEEQVRNDAYKQEQSYLTNIANDYAAEGNTGQAKAFTDRAASLFPNIASSNVPTIDLGYSGSAYTAPTLQSYLGRANNTTVTTAPGNGKPSAFNIPGLVALNKKPVGAAA